MGSDPGSFGHVRTIFQGAGLRGLLSVNTIVPLPCVEFLFTIKLGPPNQA